TPGGDIAMRGWSEDTSEVTASKPAPPGMTTTLDSGSQSCEKSSVRKDRATAKSSAWPAPGAREPRTIELGCALSTGPSGSTSDCTRCAWSATLMTPVSPLDGLDAPPLSSSSGRSSTTIARPRNSRIVVLLLSGRSGGRRPRPGRRPVGTGSPGDRARLDDDRDAAGLDAHRAVGGG